MYIRWKLYPRTSLSPTVVFSPQKLAHPVWKEFGLFWPKIKSKLLSGCQVRVVFVHFIFIQYWKLKIKTSQSWFSMFDPQKLKIKNLQSQFSIFVAKKGKIKHHSSIFWKSKTKNWKWPVSGFNFLFSISSSQDSSY